MKKTNLLFLVLLLHMGCDTEVYNHPTIDLEVSNIDLKPIGQINLNEDFYAYLHNDTMKCKLITMGVFKNDTIEKISVTLNNKTILVEVIASGNDFPPQSEDLLFQKIEFNAIGVESGTYSTKIHTKTGGTWEKEIYLK